MIGSGMKEMLIALQERRISSEALTQLHLDRIRQGNEDIGAFIDIDEQGALEQARAIDQARETGEALGSLAGVPIAVKDNINIRNRPTTCASKMLADFVSPYDAHVIEKLRDAGAVFLGKTNLDEFAMGSSTEHSAMGLTRNPYNPEYVPGGSSGGSTAAVAADMTPAALASSTGGSIRQPASFCGVVGLKPTYGRVSRYGLVAFGSSLDQIGTTAKDVDGAARLFQVIAGHDPRDSTSATQRTDDYLAELEIPVEGLKVGLPKEYLAYELDEDVRKSMDLLIEKLKERGAQFVEVSLPHTQYAVPTYYLVATAEASSNLARFDGVRYTKRADSARNLKDMYVRTRSEFFGMEVKRRILLGTYCLSSGYYEGYYLRAQKVRTKIMEDFQQAFEKVDTILSPTSPTAAFKFGAKTEDPMAMYLSDIFTVTANLAGIPAISIPTGLNQQGLPIGMQFMSPHFQEAKMLRIARQAEHALATAAAGA